MYDQYFAACHMAPLDRKVFDLAARFRVENRLKTPDALHLAAATVAGCDAFWTNDRRLLAAAHDEIQVVDWGILEGKLA